MPKRTRTLRIVNISANGTIFDPSTVTLSKEMSAEILEIMNRKEERVNIRKAI